MSLYDVHTFRKTTTCLLSRTAMNYAQRLDPALYLPYHNSEDTAIKWWKEWKYFVFAFHNQSLLSDKK